MFFFMIRRLPEYLFYFFWGGGASAGAEAAECNIAVSVSRGMGGVWGGE